MSCGKVLVVDDDQELLRLIRICLEQAHFEVHTAGDGQAGLDAVDEVGPDALVLDVNLPKMDGLSVCREIRRRHDDLPILILSAHDEDFDKVVGLEVGADDFLGKPFNPRELVARLRALIRRWRTYNAPGTETEQLKHRNLTIDSKAHAVEVSGARVQLTTTEFALLRTLASHAGQVMTRQQLLDRVWGPEFFGNERSVDVHIRKLRKKLEEHDSLDYVVSVRGIGYKFHV